MRKITEIMIIISTTLLITIAGTFAQSQYSFAFFESTSDFEYSLNIVHPNEIITSEAIALYSIPTDRFAPNKIVLSPDGRFVAALLPLVRSANVPFSMQLYDLTSNEVTEIGTGYIQSIAWSPNSQQIAVVGLGETQRDIYLYDLDTKQWINLTNDLIHYWELIWSPNGDQLAAFSDNCSTAQDCDRILKIFNLQDGTFISSPQLTEIVNTPYIINIPCNLEWSSDGRYISFVLGCFPSAEVASEVFLWDTENFAFQQLTNFTTPAYETGGQRYSPNQFTTEWYDANSLLISALYTTEPHVPLIEQTLIYDVDQAVSIPLNEMFWQQIAVSPSGQVAVRNVNVQEGLSFSQAEISNSSIKVFDIQLIDERSPIESETIQNLPSGCDPNWSPDGAIIAYRITATGYCLNEVSESLVFVDTIQGTTEQFTPENSILPIGWVVR